MNTDDILRAYNTNVFLILRLTGTLVDCIGGARRRGNGGRKTGKEGERKERTRRREWKREGN